MELSIVNLLIFIIRLLVCEQTEQLYDIFPHVHLKQIIMDNKFTEEIGQWLNKPEERDYKAGALLLLNLSGNQIMCLNNLRNPEGRREFIAYQFRSITTSTFSSSLKTKSNKWLHRLKSFPRNIP